MNIIDLIKEYLLVVNKAFKIVNELKLKYPKYINEMGMEVSDLPLTGEIEESGVLVYKFHGIGCFVKFHDFEVDFDFNFSNHDRSKIIAFSPWVLSIFAKSYKGDKYISFSDYNVLKGLLKKELENGTIESPSFLESEELFVLSKV